MHTQFLLASWNPEFTGTHLWVMVAVLACLFAAEVFGIVVLIRKLLCMREAHAEADSEEIVEETMEESAEEESEAEEPVTEYAQYAFAPLFLTAIPPITYTMLTVLVIACAVASVALVALLAVAYFKGYDFAGKAKAEDADELCAEEMDEQPAEIEYEETEESLEAAEEDAFDADVDQPLEIVEETEEEPIEDAVPVEEESAEMVGEVMAPAPLETVTTTVRTSEAIPPENGQGPYKVVEKIVTETYKEIVKEAPAGESKGASADDVLEKLSNLLDYELEKRRAADAASVAAFAQSVVDSEDDEDDSDADDDEADDGAEDVAAEEPVAVGNFSTDDRFTGNERIIGFDEATGCYLVAHYRKSFEAKLIQANPNIKKYYSELKNALLAYKGTKSRVSWTADSFHNGRSPLAKINVKTRSLELYLALDPASLEGTVYRGKDVGSKKKYAKDTESVR